MRILLNINVAEQLAGGAEAMQKAVSKWAGRDVGTDEMKAMMKDGKLIAKEILPLLAKEMAELARNGEALKNALKGLAVIESRMKTSFDDMLANIYRGGLSEGLKDLYTTLDRMFWVLSKGDSGLGGFLKGFLEGARESVEWLWDHLTLIRIMLEEEFGMKGADMEMLGKAAYYTSIIVALNTITGLMKWLISAPLLNGLAALAGKILGIGAAAETAAAATGAAGGLLAGLKGMGGRIALAAGAYTLYDWFANPHTAEGLQSGVDQLGFGNKPKLNNTPIFQGGFIGGQPNFLQNANGYLQKQQVEMTLKVDATDGFRQLAKAEVETYGAKVTQSILPTGWVSTSRE